MAIEGPLRELALTDVMQLLHLSRKTGTLSISSEAAPRPGLIHFEQGSVIGARSAGETSRLGRLLVMAGKATVGQIDAALKLQREAPQRRIGALLAETQGVAPAEVQRQLRFQVEEAVFELVRWSDGYFRFEESPPLDVGEIRIRVPTESLLMEGMRRADEWTEMASGEPDASLVPVLVDRSADPAAVLTLEPREWQVLAAVNGAHTLREIAREIGRGEFDVAKAVYSLASGGIVELRTRPVGVQSARQVERTLADEAALIETELRAGRLEEAQRRVDELSARHPRTGTVSLLRGRVLARAGLAREAAEAFEDAVRQDPLLGNAYYQLGLAAARTGDFQRAHDSFVTYGRLPEASPEQAKTALRAATLIAELVSILEEKR